MSNSARTSAVSWPKAGLPATPSSKLSATFSEAARRRAKQAMEASLLEFTRQAWHQVDSHPFVMDRHLEAICLHLEALYRGDIRALVINVPPRHSKSTIVAVLFTAWCWLHQPGLQFLTASRSIGLAARDAGAMRRLVTSRWFRGFWGDKVQLRRDSNQKARFHNTANGHRIAVGVGQGTGDGGDILICDDPTSAMQAMSDAERGNANNWIDNTLSTRFNDPKTGRFVLIMQRQHEDDATGHYLKADPEAVHLRLPAEFEPHDICVTVPLPGTDGRPWRDWRTIPDELLAPNRFPRSEINRLKRRLITEYNIAGQLQQRPVPAGGAILKAAYWLVWEGTRYPIPDLVVSSIDTAMSQKAISAYSAGTYWAVYRDFYDGVEKLKILLLFAWRERLTFNGLVERIETCNRKYKVNRTLVEAKANGISVVQEMMRRFRYTEDQIELVNPEVDKIARAWSVQGLFEAGVVMAPRIPKKDPDTGAILLEEYEEDGILVQRPVLYTPKWAQLVIDEGAAFPRGKFRDLTDTTTQAISWLRQREFNFLPEDEPLVPVAHSRPQEAHY